MSTSAEDFDDLEASLREVVELSWFTVLDVLRLPHPSAEYGAVRAEFLDPRSPRVEVVRGSIARPDTGWVVTGRNHPVPLDGSGMALPPNRVLREAPSNDDYRRLLALDRVARTLPPLEDHLGLSDAALEGLDVARRRAESTPSLVAAATTLLTDLDGGAPLEWALRRLEGVRP